MVLELSIKLTSSIKKIALFGSVKDKFFGTVNESFHKTILLLFCFYPRSPPRGAWVFRWKVSPPPHLPPLPPLPHLQTGEGEGGGEGEIHPTPTTVLCTVLYCRHSQLWRHQRNLNAETRDVFSCLFSFKKCLSFQSKWPRKRDKIWRWFAEPARASRSGQNVLRNQRKTELHLVVVQSQSHSTTLSRTTRPATLVPTTPDTRHQTVVCDDENALAMGLLHRTHLEL